MISRRRFNASLLFTGVSAQAVTATEQDASAPGIAHPGDLRPLASVLEKAAAGETITLVGVGGSITAGAGASAPGKRWLNLVAAALRRRGPSPVTLINAGVSDTKSDYGALRLERDVLMQRPDLVFLDAAVNDDGSDAPTYDTMVRRILAARICLVPIMFGTGSFGGIEDVLVPICRYYDLPVVSYVDAARECVRSGAYTQAELTAPDGIHPADAGHALAARCVERLLSLAATKVRKPLLTNAFDRVTFISNDALRYAVMHGFTYVPNPNPGNGETCAAWRSSHAGDWLTLPVTVSGEGHVWIVMDRFRTRGGKLRVQVGAEPSRVLDGHDPDLPVDERLNVICVARHLKAGTYMLRIENVSTAASAFVWVQGVGLSR